jgi:hypothetical protein
MLIKVQVPVRIRSCIFSSRRPSNKHLPKHLAGKLSTKSFLAQKALLTKARGRFTLKKKEEGKTTTIEAQ